MSELKPCPFCGGKAGLAIYYDFYRFHCPNPKCEAHLPDGVVVNGIGNWHASIPDARVAWNTRAEVAFVPGFTTATDSPPTRYVPERTCIAEENSDAFYGDCMYVCSECGADFDNEEFPKYCPQCGAKVVE